MSEVKVVLRDATQDISFDWHGSRAMYAVAALSADPVTIEELCVAMERFMHCTDEICDLQKRPRRLDNEPLDNEPLDNEPLDNEPFDAGLVVIDLAARLVVVDSTYFSVMRSGSVPFHDGEQTTNVHVRYELADEWMLSDDAEAWQSLASARRRERAQQAPLDARAVFYGRPMIEFLAAECFAIFPQREAIVQAARVRWAEAIRARHSPLAGDSQDARDARGCHTEPDPSTLSDEELAPRTRPGQERYASPYYDTLKDIHVRWLMTPREDLRGESPREVLLNEHERRMADMEHRCDQWSRTMECPRGLDVSSHAFRFGGFGTHEIVKYYDLVRELLWSCWDQLLERAQSPNPLRRPVSLALREFLTEEVPRLEHYRDEWLDTPDPEFECHTPRSIIERERCRIPEAASGSEAMIDPDCPCCQMLAELPGPMFWHLDGSGMDDDFAFDIHNRTREEWETEQREWQSISHPIRSAQVDPESWKIEQFPSDSGDSDSIWSHSYSAPNVSEAPVAIRLFCLGAHLAELLMDLRESGAEQPNIEQLNRNLGNLRQVLAGNDELRAPELVEPVVNCFRESLDNIAASHPALERKCFDLSRQLANFLLPHRSIV